MEHKPSTTFRGWRSVWLRVSMWKIFWAFQIRRLRFTGRTTCERRRDEFHFSLTPSHSHSYTHTHTHTHIHMHTSTHTPHPAVACGKGGPQILTVFLQLLPLGLQFCLSRCRGQKVTNNVLLEVLAQLPKVDRGNRYNIMQYKYVTCTYNVLYIVHAHKLCQCSY